MRLKNKRTGEIRELPDGLFCGDNLKKICEEWEDYEGPKEDGLDHIITLVEAYSNHDSERYPKEIVEKLKAWKRLRDKGFRFTGLSNESIGYEIKELSGDFALDLDLLFNGGEE